MRSRRTTAEDQAAPCAAAPAPVFDAPFLDAFAQLVRWRRDIRAFRPDPVPAQVLRACMELAHMAPSVGLSQPWRFVQVEDPARRARIIASFERANAAALAATAEADRAAYARLKLEGLREAPVQMAVFCDEETPQGRRLGAHSMPQTRAYSTVCAIHTLWLALRARGLGLGWVSILEPEEVHAACDAPPSWRFVAWLCIGWPAPPAHDTPELERAGWEARTPVEKVWKTL